MWKCDLDSVGVNCNVVDGWVLDGNSCFLEYVVFVWVCCC